MKRHQNSPIPVVLAVMAAIAGLDVPLRAEPPPVPVPVAPSKDQCADNLVGVAVVVPELDSSLFHTTKTSYPEHIIEHDDGHLENTIGGQITAEDLLRIEHTAHCTSSHQGKHLMEFSDAIATADGVRLTISGGMPAYASDLTVTMSKKLEFKCFFSAVYPAPTGVLHWKVTKKVLKLKSDKLESGSRLCGWISVEFEEMDSISKETHTYKIEGFFKPVIQSPAEDGPGKDGEKNLPHPNKS